VGEASCAPAGNSLIGDMFPANRRGRPLAVFMLGLPIGIFLSNMLGGRLAEAIGWQKTFFIAAIPGFVFAIMAFRIKESSPRAAEAVQVSSPGDGGSPYPRGLGLPTIRWS